LRALDAKIAIAKRTLEIRKESYHVYKSRVESGYCSELDCLRIESEMSSVEATLLGLEENAEKIENMLNVLIGTSPNEMMTRKAKKTTLLENLKIPSIIPSNLPSNLLERRPDIMQAENQLIAANADIGQAIAAYFPSFSLTGALGFESSHLGRLFSGSNEMHTFKSSISLPIFTAGKISSLTDIAKARYKKMLAVYEKTVQVAFKEALDALIANRKGTEIVTVRTKQVKALTRSYDIARIQKNSGLIGLIDLLDVERSLLAAEMELVGALQNRLNAIVDLCKSLGGGWSINNYATAS
jgi:multidrug efflux system outer membrane protein